jgi:acyl-CoA thioesterase YciA
MSSQSNPEGDLVTRSIAMPSDTNVYGDIFGGWLLSQMDLGGSVLAHQCSRNRMTTIAVDGMVFIKPVFIGDLVSCYAKVHRKGNTSVTIAVDTWVTRRIDESRHHVTKGLFTYVAINDQGRPTPIKWRD